MFGWFRKHVKKIGFFGIEVEFTPAVDPTKAKPTPSLSNIPMAELVRDPVTGEMKAYSAEQGKQVAGPPPKKRFARLKWFAGLLMLAVVVLAATESRGLTHLLGKGRPQQFFSRLLGKTEPPATNRAEEDEPVPVVVPLTESEKRIAALPAAEQVEAVRKEFKRLNPGFAGSFTPSVVDNAVVELSIEGGNAWDISSLRPLRQLRRLNITGAPLADLTPLTGMNLTTLELNECDKLTDLTPLRGLPLEHLSVRGWSGSNLAPLRRMPLKLLNCSGNGQRIDLAPLAGVPLESLYANSLELSDLTPLRGMPLANLQCNNTSLSDLSPLSDLKLTHLSIQNTKVSDLSPLRGMPLTSLVCDKSPVTNFSPVVNSPLVEITCDFKTTRDASVLRSIKTLEKINDAPAAEQLLKKNKKK